jgi:Tfp pilus assembly protein PilP
VRSAWSVIVVVVAACAPAPLPPSPPVTTGSSDIARHPETATIARVLDEHVNGWDAHRVWIVDYRQDGRHVDVVGEAVDADDIARFMRRVAANRMFADVSLGASSVSNGAVRFAMAMTSTQDAPVSYAIHTWPRFTVMKPAPETTRPVAEGVAIDRIKLVGVVEAERSKAMLGLPDGTSVIVKVGDVVGDRWYVTRIAGTEVVLVRDGVERRLHF